ncbi:MAG: endo-1,4-beta-xylanase [Clostridium sp.]|nr:endo-1,4-beta-xylanase [Clostridium sp.]
MQTKKSCNKILAIMLTLAMVIMVAVPAAPATAATNSTYDFSQMSYSTGWYSSYSVSGKTLEVNFNELYGEVQFMLPATLDMANCTGVTFNVASNGGELAFKLYSIAGDEVAVNYNYTGSSTCTFVPDTTEKVNCIGIMSQSEQGFQAKISSVTFAMTEGSSSSTNGTVSSSDTLLNTYGKAFGNVGTCITPRQLSDSGIFSFVKNQYNSITMENEMKPDALLNSSTISVATAKQRGYYIPANYTESTVPSINFSTVDSVMKTCYENGLRLRAHTLIWHSQTPEWFFRNGFQSGGSYVSQAQMDARIEFYVKSVMSHVYDSQYGSVVYAWDICNEYFHANNSGWQQIYGSVDSLGSKPSFVKKAFQFANECLESYGLTDSVSLFYNDYNTYIECDKIISMINWINAEKKICNGVGMQAHLDTQYPSASLFKSTIAKFAAEGFEIQITELDATCTNESTQAQYYYSIMSGILAQKKAGANITGITWWGLYDSVSWRSSQNPLLFSGLNKPKAAYTSVLQAFADSGIASGTTTSKPPVVTSQAPVVTSQAPVVTSQAPVVTSQAPVVTSQAPVVTSQAPVVTSEAPYTGSVKPVVSVNATSSGGINLNVQISATGSDALDFSKLVIRYKYTKSNSEKEIFWCDNAGLQLSQAPYYANMTSAIKATFGSGYLDISFTGTETLTPGQGSLAIGARITLDNWASYSNFAEQGYEVYYDGKLVSSK